MCVFGASEISRKRMGIPSEMRDMWVNRGKGLLIPSPAEEQKRLRSAKCTQGLFSLITDYNLGKLCFHPLPS